jgi:hypothetical protein
MGANVSAMFLLWKYWREKAAKLRELDINPQTI